MRLPIASCVARSISKGRRHALKLKYYERIKLALSAKLAARFIQVESHLLTMTDLQISSALPVIK